MSKSRDAFRTISEVSEFLDTPAHVLRFWESKFSQIKPVKRAGGRRYYRPDDMALLSGIKQLLHEQGMTIKGAQKLLREQGVRHVVEIGLAAGPVEIEEMGDTVEAVVSHEVAAEDMAQPVTAAPEPESAPEPAPEPVAPAAWDPDDPWPADPVARPAEDPAAQPADLFETAQAQTPEQEAATAPPEPGSDALPDDAPFDRDDPVAAPPVMPPPPRHEGAMPFVRARAEASDAPEPGPEAEILSFAPTPRPAVPDLPDEAAIPAHPGALTALIGADPGVLRANAARIAPLAARLRVLADRLSV